MSPATAPRFAWLDGRLVPWSECVLHARTQAAFWGANVFEGVRAYWHEVDGRLALFRLEDHLTRLWGSMRSLQLPAPYGREEVAQACADLLRANEYREDVHVVVVAYFGMGEDFDPLRHTDDTGLHITACPFRRPPAYHRGAAVAVSSWRRISDDTMPPRIKAGANYHNSRLAYQEAVRNGYDNALILNRDGMLAEGPAACVVVARDGVLVSPPATSGALEGITLATVAQLAGDELGLPFEHREIDRTDLYVADEAFFCGTVAEIQPIVSVDRVPVGGGVPGPLTRRLQGLYDCVVREGSEGRGWTRSVSLDPGRTATATAGER
jgi:branched-chain amino acid aminotransferase